MSLFDPFHIQTKYVRKSHNGQVNRVKLPTYYGKAYTQEEIERVKQFLEAQGYSIILTGRLPSLITYTFVQTFTDFSLENVQLPNDGYISLNLSQIFTMAGTTFDTFKNQVVNRNIQNGVIQFALTSFTNMEMKTYNGAVFPQQTTIFTTIELSGIPVSRKGRTSSTAQSRLPYSDRMIQSYTPQQIIITEEGNDVDPVLEDVNLPTTYLYAVNDNSLTNIQSFLLGDYSPFQNDIVFRIIREADSLADPLLVPKILLVFTLIITVNVSI